MRYIEVTEHELKDARPGLTLIEQLLKDENFQPFLYGLTTKDTVLLSASDALAEDAEEAAASAPKLSEVALAIPFSSDLLYYLTGSGLTLRNEEFAYRSGSDGVRTMGLTFSSQHPKVSLEDFTKLALSDSDSWLNDFYTKYGAQTSEAWIPATVSREGVPAVKASSKVINPRKVVINPIDAFLS